MSRPDPSEHAPYFSRYIELVPEDDIRIAMQEQSEETQRLLSTISEQQSLFRYAEGKWIIKELIGHVTDTERVFQYRLMSIARGEAKPLPGFDEGEYVAAASFERNALVTLGSALLAVRQSTLALIDGLPPEAWDRRGIANDNPVTVRAIAYTALGHERHHLKILRERYLL